MTAKLKSSYIDIVLGIVFVLFGITVYRLTLGLPGPTYDPLGPAFMPRMLALCSLACSGMILFQGIRKRIAAAKEHKIEETPVEPVPFKRHPLTAVSAMALVFFYILALDLGLSGFRTLTVVFILVLGGLLLKAESWGSRAKKGVFLVVLAVILSFGLFYLFTRVFIVDLY